MSLRTWRASAQKVSHLLAGSVNPGSAAIMIRSAELAITEHESISGANLIAIPISIEENYFLKSCVNKGIPDLFDLLSKNELLHVNEIKLSKIRQLILFIFRQNDIEDSQLHHIMEIELVDLLIDCLSDALETKPTNEITNRNFYNIVDNINHHKNSTCNSDNSN